MEAARLLRAGELPLWSSRISTGFPINLSPEILSLWFCSWCCRRRSRSAGTSPSGSSPPRSAPTPWPAGTAQAAQGASWPVSLSPGRVSSSASFGTSAPLAVVALFPAALLCLERAAGGGLGRALQHARCHCARRLLWLTGFAAIFGLQLLAGFPQSAYNAALVYAALVAARCLWLLAPASGGAGWRPGAAPAAGLAAGALAAVLDRRSRRHGLCFCCPSGSSARCRTAVAAAPWSGRPSTTTGRATP